MAINMAIGVDVFTFEQYMKNFIMKLLLRVLVGLIGLLTLAFLVVYFFGTSDLRTDTAENNSNPEKAAQLLAQMAKAHQIEAWDSIESYEVIFEDEFYGFMGATGNPFAENKAKFRLQYLSNSYDGRLTILSGKETGSFWGLQSWQTYKGEGEGAPQFKKHINAKFWVPTYQYFIEFPKRILKANALAYAGEKVINHIECEGVIASWNTTAPQRKIDQYLIWIDKDTKRIVKLEYTIREMYNFLTGAAYFQEYQEFDGVLLPTRFPVESNLVNEGLLHEMRIHDFKKKTIPTTVLRPNAALEQMGDQKE